GQAMLSVDNEKAGFGIFQVAHRLVLAHRSKLQDLFRKQENGSRNGRLCFSLFVEVDDIANLSPAQQALKRFLASLHGTDEFSDRIGGVGLGFNRLAFKIKPAGELDAMEDVASLKGNEVEDPVLLAYTCSKHRDYLTRYGAKNLQVRRGVVGFFPLLEKGG